MCSNGRLTILLALGVATAPGCGVRQDVASHEGALAEGRGADDGTTRAIVYTPEAEPGIVVGEDDLSRALEEDVDGDGWPGGLDADDADPFTYPGAVEQPCDGVDQDGNGFDDCPLDVDQDGARDNVDCDDLDPAIGPLVPEVRCNGRDENCNGRDECDRDGDGALDDGDLEPDDPSIGYPEPAEEPEG